MFVEISTRDPVEELESSLRVLVGLEDFGHLMGSKSRSQPEDLRVLLPLGGAEKVADSRDQIWVMRRGSGGQRRGDETTRIDGDTLYLLESESLDGP